MKAFLKSLKRHPGVNIAISMTLLGFFAGAMRNSYPNELLGGILGAGFMAIFCWTPVLITAWVKSRKRE